jgi:hypothetical protein
MLIRQPKGVFACIPPAKERSIPKTKAQRKISRSNPSDSASKNTAANFKMVAKKIVRPYSIISGSSLLKELCFDNIFTVRLLKYLDKLILPPLEHQQI